MSNKERDNKEINQEGGGAGAPDSRVFVPASLQAKEADRLYIQRKEGVEIWLKAFDFIPFWGNIIRSELTSWMQHSENLDTKEIADKFRELGNRIRGNSPESEIEKVCNNRLWTHNQDGTLNHITSRDIVPLFDPAYPKDWPNLVLTSNHARANESKDLSELMEGIESLVRDAWNKPLPLCRLTQATQKSAAKGKTIVALACHTEPNILLNGAELLDRRLALENDPNANDPKLRTREHMSPASMRLAKLMLKMMVEPASVSEVNLDRAVRESEKHPFVADELALKSHEDTRYADKHPIVLRADAARIAQHIQLIGYSKGANAVTDALRFLYQECAMLGDQLQIRDKSGVIRAANDADIRTIISNVGLLSLNPGEVPLTEAEKYQVGIRRVTIHNADDLTAGHMIKPDKSRYDRWSDRLIEIKGTIEEFGHSLAEALGTRHKSGYIMDTSRSRSNHDYQVAQDEVKAFFSMHHQKHAITTFCFDRDDAVKQNILYVQFAPGISRVDEGALEQHILSALRERGFAGAHMESDMTHRRRMRVVLDSGQDVPIAKNQDALEKVKAAVSDLAAGDSNLFIEREGVEYLEQAIANAKPRGAPSHASRVNTAEGHVGVPKR